MKKLKNIGKCPALHIVKSFIIEKIQKYRNCPALLTVPFLRMSDWNQNWFFPQWMIAKKGSKTYIGFFNCLP